MAYIAMAYIVMAYIVMAYIVTAYTVVAYIVMPCTPHRVKAPVESIMKAPSAMPI